MKGRFRPTVSGKRTIRGIAGSKAKPIDIQAQKR